MPRLVVALILGLVLTVSPAFAQMSEVSLDARTDDAALIVEATVLTSTPFWNPDGTRILTAHRLEVHKVLKMAGRPRHQVSRRIRLKLWAVGPTSGWEARNTAIGTTSSGVFTHSLSMLKTESLDPR